jgi:hypothetical protein
MSRKRREAEKSVEETTKENSNVKTQSLPYIFDYTNYSTYGAFRIELENDSYLH